MKRPLALVGLGFAAALAVLFAFGLLWFAAAFVAALVLSVMYLIAKGRRLSFAVVILLCSVSALAALCYHRYARDHERVLTPASSQTPGSRRW